MMRSKTNFRDLPGLLARAHKALRVVRDPALGALCVENLAGPRPTIVGVFADAEDTGGVDLMLTLEPGHDWAELLLQLAALMHEREAFTEQGSSMPCGQITTRLQ